MKELVEFIMNHAVRGACQCGRCAKSITVDPASGEITGVELTDPIEAAKHQPTGHTADVGFFKVAAQGDPSPDKLKELIQANQVGEFGDMNLLDGQPHHFIEMGGWIGSQELALMLIGLGNVMGLWDVFNPGGQLPMMMPKRSKA